MNENQNRISECPWFGYDQLKYVNAIKLEISNYLVSIYIFDHIATHLLMKLYILDSKIFWNLKISKILVFGIQLYLLHYSQLKEVHTDIKYTWDQSACPGMCILCHLRCP